MANTYLSPGTATTPHVALRRTAITTSRGSADAGAIPALNTAGMLDSTLLPSQASAAASDNRILSAIASEVIPSGSIVRAVSTATGFMASLATNTSRATASGVIGIAISGDGNDLAINDVFNIVTEGLVTLDHGLAATDGAIFLDSSGDASLTAPTNAEVRAGAVYMLLGRIYSGTQIYLQPFANAI